MPASKSRLTSLLALLVMGLPFGLASAAHADDEAGKAIFLEQECNGCHTIKALSIAVEEVADDDEEKDDREPPDLSGVGNERDKTWIAKYMIKREKIDDKDHPRRFRGSKDELATLATWLETLKHTDADAGAAEGAAATDDAGTSD